MMVKENCGPVPQNTKDMNAPCVAHQSISGHLHTHSHPLAILAILLTCMFLQFEDEPDKEKSWIQGEQVRLCKLYASNKIIPLS